jgi:hypothetical protein
MAVIHIAAFATMSQSENPSPDRPNSTRSPNSTEEKKVEKPEASTTQPEMSSNDGNQDPSDTEPEDKSQAAPGANPWYLPPTAKERRDRYVRSAFGPVAITRYTIIAGVLTARNAPREWGGTWEGFGRRFASNAAEGLIKQTVRFGLDEALDTDSTFYLSRDRRPIARMRNAVFSAVTSRDRKGRRVFGLPKIAGHLTANIASAELWYPQRYTYRHGLKGAAISLAVDIGVNLFREFFWKR